MANRKLVIEVVGDASKLDRTFKQAAVSTNRFAQSVDKAGKATGLNTGLFALANRGNLIAAGSAAAALGIKSVLDASKNAEVILGQTSVAVDDAGLSWEKNAARIQAAALQISKTSAFDDEKVLQSFSVFVRGQKDIGKSLELSALAADVARGRFIDLDQATQLVNKAAFGQIGALRRAGIQIDKNATSTEALTALTRAYGGAAQRYATTAAGSQDKLRVSVENLRESIGAGLLPVLTEAVNTANDFVEASGHLGDALRDVGVKASDVGKGLGAAFLATPGLGIAIGEVKVLNKLFGDTEQQIGDVNAAAKAFAETVAGINFNPGNVPTPQNPNQSGPGRRKPSFGEPGFKPGTAPRIPTGPTVEQRNRFFDDAIARREDRVQDISSLQGQVAELDKIAALIQQRIEKTKDITRRLNLEDELVRVQRQRKSVVAEIADQQAQAAADAAEKVRKAKERQQELADALAKRVQIRQNVALGDVTPGVDNLRKQLESLTDRLDEQHLHLGSKLGGALAGARKILAGELGKATEESRQRIQQLFDTIRGEFDKGAKQGPLTQTHALNTKRILAGLGLSPADERELRSRLSVFNSAGRALGGNPQQSRGALGGSVVVTSPDVFLDGQKVSTSTRRHNTVHARRNPKQKRGARF